MWTRLSKPSVYNFSHVYEAYDFMREDDFSWVDCTQLESTDCYCDTEAEKQLKELIGNQPLGGIHWIDSGDYHYLSKLLTDRITEPFTLVVLDHHPDMQRPMFGELLSCGSWVRVALEQNLMLKQVWLLGVDDKLIEETSGFDDKVRVISENDLLRQPTDKIIEAIQLDYPVYLSIDKDVMTPNECTTNWDQGSMSWKQLEFLLGHLLQHKVLGIDICGEEPKILTECCYGLDASLNAKFNEGLYNLIKEII